MWYNGLEGKNDLYIENKMSILVGMPWLRQLRTRKGILKWDWSISFFLMQKINFEEGSCCKVHRKMRLINCRKHIESPISKWCDILTSTECVCSLVKSVFTFDDHTVAHFPVCWKLIETKSSYSHVLEITGVFK